MPFRFPSHRILEVVRAPKCPRISQRIDWESEGQTGKCLKLDLDLIDGPLVGLRLHVNCHDSSNPSSYRAALVLEGERVRGVDFSLTARKKFYKEFIPRGWHENVIDPNLPTSDPNRNRHLPLPDFAPVDLRDFVRLLAERWHIELNFEQTLL